MLFEQSRHWTIFVRQRNVGNGRQVLRLTHVQNRRPAGEHRRAGSCFVPTAVTPSIPSLPWYQSVMRARVPTSTTWVSPTSAPSAIRTNPELEVILHAATDHVEVSRFETPAVAKGHPERGRFAAETEIWFSFVTAVHAACYAQTIHGSRQPPDPLVGRVSERPRGEREFPRNHRCS